MSDTTSARQDGRIFTLGHHTSYLACMAEFGTDVKKRGPFRMENGEIYRGGIVFRSTRDAIAWRDTNGQTTWSVFVISGDWEADTYWDAQSGHYRIKRDLQILEAAQ